MNAYVQDSVELSYAELNRRANRLAHELIRLGVGPDGRVALCTERHPQMVVGLLAILKAGGAYVPVDPSHPRKRLEELVRDAEPVLVLCDAVGREALGAEAVGALPILALDGSSPGGELERDPEVPGLSSAHLAYVIYTSGSTGTPKGVMVEHRSLVNHTTWQARAFGFSATDAELQHSSISFDFSVSELWGPLVIGARVVLLPGGADHDVDRIAATMDRHRVTIAQFVPSQLQMLTQGTHGISCEVVIVGGEALDAGLAAGARARAGRVLVNCYGPTETTIDAVTWRCSEGELPARIPIGRPIANARIYLLDAHGEPVPVGAVSELCVGGAGVARGYLHRPELTAERFVRDPFSGEPGARMYRTGDLARYLPDGNLEFLGRNDHQVKIRGYRIELGEIEARLCEHSTVREAVVVAREDAPGALCRPVFPWARDKRLIAYLTTMPRGGDAPAGELVAALRQHLADQLPEYMVPSAFVRLEALPLTANGKLDRKALPAPDSGAVLARAYEAPRGTMEETLATVWAELLGLDRVGRRDHFFELGGHSLVAVKLVERLRRLGVDIELRLVYQGPILEDLAQRITSKDDRNDSRAVPARTSGSQSPIFFVPTGMGNYSYSFELASDLDPTLPIYALPWDMGEAPAITLEALAARMVPLMQAVQACGPYRLAGYSSGGLLAYAIAEHLLGMGEVVSFIGLLDVGVPDPDHAKPLSAKQMVLEHIIAKLETDAAARQRVEEVAGDLSLLELVQEGERLGVMQKDTDTQGLVRIWEQISAFDHATWRYRPPSVPLAVHLFQSSESNDKTAAAEETIMDEADPTGGWGRVLPSSSIHQIAVPGDHTTMMTEAAHRRTLGALISQAVGRS